jgi:hypothetical protein
MLISLEVAGFEVTHDALDCNTQVILSLVAGVWEKVELVAPDTGLPFTFHWYPGDEPPLNMVEVKLTGSPVHDGLEDAVITMFAGSKGLTVMAMGAEKAGLPIAQTSLEVTTHETAWLFAGM